MNFVKSKIFVFNVKVEIVFHLLFYFLLWKDFKLNIIDLIYKNNKLGNRLVLWVNSLNRLKKKKKQFEKLIETPVWSKVN